MLKVFGLMALVGFLAISAILVTNGLLHELIAEIGKASETTASSETTAMLDFVYRTPLLLTRGTMCAVLAIVAGILKRLGSISYWKRS